MWYTFSMNDQLSDETRVSPSSKDALIANAIKFLLAAGFLLWGGYQLWSDADAHGFIPHTRLASVSSESWTVGEYKDCFSLNIRMDQPILSCDNLLGSNKEKVFKVLFWGKTYIEGKPENTALEWRCTKTGDADPSIRCEKR